MDKPKLTRELKSAGAKDSEISALAAVAERYTTLRPKPPSAQPMLSRRLLPTSLALVTGLIIGVILITASLTVQPGNALYVIQKMTDNAAVALDSNYRATVMMKRTDQIKRLVDGRASQTLVLATIHDYQKEANQYRAKASYATIEYCQSNLRQADLKAKDGAKKALDYSLSTLSKAGV